jgi:hypothetical protein
MSKFFLRMALPAVVLAVASPLAAQSRPDSVKRQQPPVVRDSAAGTLEDAEARFGRLLSSLNTLEVNTARFAGITGLTAQQIQLVDVRNLLRGNNQQALDEAYGRNERKVIAMREQMQQSTVLRDLLSSRDINMSDVMAVDVEADGSGVIVFYRPQA